MTSRETKTADETTTTTTTVSTASATTVDPTDNHPTEAVAVRLRVEYQTAKNRGLHFALTKRSGGMFLLKGWMRRRDIAIAQRTLEAYIRAEFGELLPYEIVDRTGPDGTPVVTTHVPKSTAKKDKKDKG